MEVQVYDYYTNEIIETAKIHDLSKKYKKASTVLYRHVNNHHKTNSKTLHLGFRNAYDSIEDRVKNRLDNFLNVENYNFYHMVNSFSWKIKNDSLNVHVNRTYNNHKISFKKSISIRNRSGGQTKTRRPIEEFDSLISEYKQQFLQEIVFFIWREIAHIRKCFGNPNQSVHKKDKKMILSIARINPTTLEVIEVNDESGFFRNKYGKCIEWYHKKDVIYKYIAKSRNGYCFIERNNHKLGDVIDWINIDENLKCDTCQKNSVWHKGIKCHLCKHSSVEKLLRYKLNVLKRGDHKKNRSFTIDDEDVKNKLHSWDCKTCEYCGVDLFENPCCFFSDLTIDSHEPFYGHLKGKWSVVCNFCNYAKNSSPKHEFDIFMKMLKSNELDLSYFYDSENYKLQYPSRCINNINELSIDELYEMFNEDKLISHVYDLPYLPVVHVDGKNCFMFSPSLDRIDNDNRKHDRENVNIVPLWFNHARRASTIEETIDYINKTFPNFNPKTMKLTLPSNFDLNKWASHEAFEQTCINRSIALRGYNKTDEKVKALMLVETKKDLKNHIDFINLTRRIYNKTYTDLDFEIFCKLLEKFNIKVGGKEIMTKIGDRQWNNIILCAKWFYDKYGHINISDTMYKNSNIPIELSDKINNVSFAYVIRNIRSGGYMSGVDDITKSNRIDFLKNNFRYFNTDIEWQEFRFISALEWYYDTEPYCFPPPNYTIKADDTISKFIHIYNLGSNYRSKKKTKCLSQKASNLINKNSYKPRKINQYN